MPFTCVISWDALAVAFRGNLFWDSPLIAARVVPTHYLRSCSAALHPPQRVSLGFDNETLLERQWRRWRRAEVIVSGRAARCFFSGRQPQHGSGCGVPQHSVTLHISSPPQSQPESPLSPLPPFETGPDKFDLAACGRPFPGKENKYCYNGNNIYLEHQRQTAAGPFEGDPSVLLYSCLILIHESRGYAY